MTDAIEEGFDSLFNGRDLTGWFATPRTYGTLWPGGPTVADVAPDLLPDDYERQAAQHPAVWTVEDGVIVGRQETPGNGWGGYLVSERTFGDFELRLEANPDWPADTGIYLRKLPHSFHGIQVLVDHRVSGSIGGFYGNGIGGFHAVPFNLDARYDANGQPVGLGPDDPATQPRTLPRTQARHAHPRRHDSTRSSPCGDGATGTSSGSGWSAPSPSSPAGSTTCSSQSWTWPCSSPVTTTPTPSPTFSGPRGHIAFEVHDNDTSFGERRWGPHAACRWRNIRIREL